MEEIGSKGTEARVMKYGSVEIGPEIMAKMLILCMAEAYRNV